MPVLVSQVRVCVPQLPQVCEDAPVHMMLTPVHAPHEHVDALHICVPLLFAPHIWVDVPPQTPWFMHADQALNSPVFVLHVRICIPQLPHACAVAPVQVWPVHAPYWQVLGLHVCVPPLPHV
jgi:hypothetical protein